MPSTRAAEPPGQPHRRHRRLAAIRLSPGGRIDEEELSSAILGTVVGLSTMVAAGAHATLGQVELTVLVTVAIYWAADCYARLLAARGAGKPTKVGSVLRRNGRWWRRPMPRPWCSWSLCSSRGTSVPESSPRSAWGPLCLEDWGSSPHAAREAAGRPR